MIKKYTFFYKMIVTQIKNEFKYESQIKSEASDEEGGAENGDERVWVDNIKKEGVEVTEEGDFEQGEAE